MLKVGFIKYYYEYIDTRTNECEMFSRVCIARMPRKVTEYELKYFTYVTTDGVQRYLRSLQGICPLPITFILHSNYILVDQQQNYLFPEVLQLTAGHQQRPVKWVAIF